MGTLKYKGYLGTVEYSEEDNCLYGKAIGMSKNSITYEGLTVEELKTDFESGIDLYIDSCKERGIKPQKPYSGSLNIRIPSDLHNKLALKAQRTGQSINAIIKDLLTSQQDLLNA